MRGDWHLHPRDAPGEVALSPDDINMATSRESGNVYGSSYRSVAVDQEGNLWSYSSQSQASGYTYAPNQFLGNYESFLVQYGLWREWAAGAAATGGAFVNR